MWEKLLHTLPRPHQKKRSFLSFFSSVPNKTKKQKVYFLPFFLLKHSIWSQQDSRISIFKPRTNQNGEHPLKENQYCINIFFYSFLYYYFFLFNFLFDSIYFYFCVDYLLIIFIIFDILMGGMVWIYGGDAQRPMVCHVLIM